MNPTIDHQLAAMRPTDATVDAELSEARRRAILESILGEADAGLGGHGGEPARTVDARERPGGETLAPVVALDERRAAHLSRPERRPRPAHGRRPLGRRLVGIAAGVALLAGVGAAFQLTPLGSKDGPLAPVVSAIPTVDGQPVLPVSAPTAAAETLGQVAQVAAAAPAVSVGPTQYLHLVVTDGVGSAQATVHDEYVAADGWTWRKDSLPSHETAYMLYNPNDQGIGATGLPTDPAALEKALRARATGTSSPDQALFKELGELAMTYTAPPAVRSAAIQVLQNMAERTPTTVTGAKGSGKTTPKVATSTSTIDGTPVVTATFSDLSRPQSGTVAYSFDAVTSQVVREQTEVPGAGVGATGYRLVGVVDALPAELTKALGTAKVTKNVNP